MQVRDLMNPSVVSITPSESASLAARLLSRHNVGSLPVCGEDGGLRGIVTDRDIILRCVAAEEDPLKTQVKDIMTRNCAVVSPDDDAREATRIMAAKHAHDLTANHYKGSWGKWCAAVGISRDTGENMVRVAEQFGNIQLEGKSILDVQPLKLLYAAAKPSTPTQVKQAVFSGDITSYKEYQELLAQINGLLEDREQETRALREQEESLRRQIANVSHDLRTPLTSILGYLQLLESERLTSQQRRHYLEIVSDRARVLQDLITAFYDLSRIEGGEYPLDLQPVDLRRALEPLLAGFYEDFERAGFQVTVELDEHLPPVLADPGAVTRILTNLIGNALKHGRAALTIRLYASGGQLVTAFSNNAPGLSPEDLSRVFERFYTADQMRTGQNTGLGLAIVKALAQRMGHTPFAELDDGTFTVGVRWKPLLPSSREAPRPLQIN